MCLTVAALVTPRDRSLDAVEPQLECTVYLFSHRCQQLSTKFGAAAEKVSTCRYCRRTSLETGHRYKIVHFYVQVGLYYHK